MKTMNTNLESYLNHHLAGAEGGYRIAARLAETATDPAEKIFFHGLRDTIAEERGSLEEMITDAEFEVKTLQKVTGAAASRISLWGMAMEGSDNGDLGRFEMVELLAIGIHGKHLLWKIMRNLSLTSPFWNEHDFEKLTENAAAQEASIEIYRTQEAGRVFAE